MTCTLLSLTIAARDPQALERFWAALLGPDAGFELRFRQTDQPRVGSNQAHFDLSSSSLEDQRATVEHALALGAQHLDVGQLPEEEHVVLADPEGNEFCVIEPGNSFLAGTARIGALSCDGSQQVGYFWSRALGWPLVWDQDEETAIQAPDGGSKISWGGPPFAMRTGRNRLHLDLVAADLDAELDRLLALGARRTDLDPDRAGGIFLADPDGNEFCVHPPR